MLYLPKAVCASTSTDASAIGALPLVFSIHCLGCSMQTMEFWSEIAEEYNFIWVNPEGIRNSFNAGDESCCGYALEQGIDDYGFLKGITKQLSTNFSWVSTDTVYAMGWSNGGYMVSFAAPLFRAIAPISGYQLDIDKLQKRMTKPVSLFLHHALDDNMVSITGCCTDPTMPGCCCGLSNHADQCISAETHVRIWASQFNQCGNKTQISYSVQDQVDCTTFTDCQGQSVNTTYCIYQHKAHFNRPSFEDAFPMSMSIDIADFFARDACSINGGSWDAGQRSCSCTSANSTGIYCLLLVDGTRLPVTTSELLDNQPPSQTAKSLITVAMLAAVTILLVLSFFSVLCRRKRSRQRYGKVSTRDVELVRV
jgi:poly(3-hydroxybutyrate) depolymerase